MKGEDRSRHDSDEDAAFRPPPPPVPVSGAPPAAPPESLGPTAPTAPGGGGPTAPTTAPTFHAVGRRIRPRTAVVAAVATATVIVATVVSVKALTGGGAPSPAISPARTRAAAPPATQKPATPSASPNQSHNAVAALSGTWSGIWHDTSPDIASGTFTIRWKQSGSVLAGTVSIAGTPCVHGGTIGGRLRGKKISFGAVQGAADVAYTGAVSGNSMAGTYTSSSSCGIARGRWSATKTG